MSAELYVAEDTDHPAAAELIVVAGTDGSEPATATQSR